MTALNISNLVAQIAIKGRSGESVGEVAEAEIHKALKSLGFRAKEIGKVVDEAVKVGAVERNKKKLSLV